MTIHLMLIFCIGIFVGVSLVSHSDDLNFEIRNSLHTFRETFGEIDQDYEVSMKQYKYQFNLYKRFIYNGGEMQCKQLSNYTIDNNTNGRLRVIFTESFHKKPEVFLTINGFYYKPHMGLKEKAQQTLQFEINHTSKRSFKLLIQTDEANRDYFKIEDFDRIDLCYFAFVKINTDEDLEINKDNEALLEDD